MPSGLQQAIACTHTHLSTVSIARVPSAVQKKAKVVFQAVGESTQQQLVSSKALNRTGSRWNRMLLNFYEQLLSEAEETRHS
jgi:hypothetical protein